MIYTVIRFGVVGQEGMAIVRIPRVIPAEEVTTVCIGGATITVTYEGD